MTQSSCKRDTKSKRHVGMKLAPLRVFSCKHPLNYSSAFSLNQFRSERSVASCSKKKELLFWLARGLNRLTCGTLEIREDSKLRD